MVPFLRILFGARPARVPKKVLAWVSLGFDEFVQSEGASVALAALCGAIVVLALLKMPCNTRRARHSDITGVSG